MPSFHEYLMRHGEFSIQALIEHIERYEGIIGNNEIPLEQRWLQLMRNA
jgi:hypothetical protein